MPDDHVPAASARLRHVDPAYRHRPKLVTPQASIELRGARLKWYDLAYAETPVRPEIRALARDYLTAESAAGRLGLDGDLGFVVLHRCNNGFFFLIVSTWRGENELWESVYYKQNAATPASPSSRARAGTRAPIASGSWARSGTNSRPGSAS